MRPPQASGDPYSKVRDAALSRDQADTSRTWALADAVLAMVPPESRSTIGSTVHKGSPREAGTSVGDRLGDLADRLYEDGVTQPTGGTYSATSLKALRETAMAWPKSDRHAETAFRTHQEAGAKNGNGRAILTALCSMARGTRVARPILTDNKGVEICTADVWTEVRTAIGTRKSKAAVYPVSANDLRRCLERKPNVPTPNVPAAATSSTTSSTPSTTSTPTSSAVPANSTPAAASSPATSSNSAALERHANDGAQTQNEATHNLLVLLEAFQVIINRQKVLINALTGAQRLDADDYDTLDTLQREALDNQTTIGILLGEKPTDADFQRLLEDTR